MFDDAPAYDLEAALAPLGAQVRCEIVLRWVDRLARQLAPEALRHVGCHDEAAELLVACGEEVHLAECARLSTVAHALYMRTWPKQAAPSDGGIAHFLCEGVRRGANALAHEAGLVHTVIAEWSEESGPGAEIPQSSEELVQAAIWRAMAVGNAARSAVQIARGERGFRDEVARQHAELARADGSCDRVAGDKWGILEAGKRYRVYSSFEDLDGSHHPWGEAWRFEGFVFDPGSWELTLDVTNGIQLDPRGAPSHEIPARPFRLGLARNRGGYALDPIRYLITTE